MDSKPIIAGNNTLTINQATIKQAVEYWLNNIVLRQPVTVMAVTENRSNNLFEISISESESLPKTTGDNVTSN